MKEIKKLTLALTLILFCFLSNSQGTWTAKSDFLGGKNSTAVGFSVGQFGYVFGGTDGTQDFATLWQYDPSLNTWVAKKSMPGSGRREAACFVIDTVAYVGLGTQTGNTTYEKSMYKYFPKANTWTKIADLPLGRISSVGFAIDSIGYIFGGLPTLSVPNKTLYAYNPRTNTWTTKSDFIGTTARSFSKALVLGTKAYIFGGYYAGCLKDFYSYDGPTDKWTKLTDAPFSCRYGMSCFIVNNQLYYGQGYLSGTSYDDWYSYDTKTDKWTTVASSGHAYGQNCAYFSVRNKGYITTGTSATTLTKETHEFNPNNLGISDLDNGAKINFYASENTLFYNLSELQKSDIKVFDCSGKIILEQECNESENKIKLNIKSGVYFAQIRTSFSSGTFKFVISE